MNAPVSCCTTQTVIVSEAIVLSYARHLPRVRPTQLCLGCGALDGRTDVAQFDDLTIAKVRMQHLIATAANDSAVALGLPSLATIAGRGV